jgi:hypothetical protein
MLSQMCADIRGDKRLGRLPYHLFKNPWWCQCKGSVHISFCGNWSRNAWWQWLDCWTQHWYANETDLCKLYDKSVIWDEFNDLNSLTPKSVLAGTNNSRSEGFWLAKHKHTNIPTMMEPFPPPAAWFWWIKIPHPWEPLCKGLDEAAVKGF